MYEALDFFLNCRLGMPGDVVVYDITVCSNEDEKCENIETDKSASVHECMR